MRWSCGLSSRSKSDGCLTGGAPFILALREGKTLGEAAAIAAEEAPGFALEANLAGLIASGAIIGIAPAADPIL